MKNKVVLDSSALLAVFYEEPGQEIVAPLLSNSLISTVNLCEVVSRVLKKEWPSDFVLERLDLLQIEIVAFNFEQAKIAGELITVTQSYGLSLGDRACLALALYEQLPVYTSDSIWQKLKLGIEIHQIR